MSTPHFAVQKAEAFCHAYGLQIPILAAPMAGVSPPSLAIAAGNAGALSACGALLMKPQAIRDWAASVRAGTNGPFQINTWIPDPAPVRDSINESKICEFLGAWGPAVHSEAGTTSLVDFEAQCESMLDARPMIMSSIMGVYPAHIVERMKTSGIKWFAHATTVTEAKAAVSAGADAVIAQGMEAGGHRGAFDGTRAEADLAGLFALLPAIVDAVGADVPVVATGGIADGRGIAAALILGASAVQIGTGLLRTPEAKLNVAWAVAIGNANPEDTTTTRAFSGRLGRSVATAYVKAANAADAPTPAPYPVQRALTQAMRDAGHSTNDIDRIQAWAGQSARLASTEPAEVYLRRIWSDAQALLSGPGFTSNTGS